MSLRLRPESFLGLTIAAMIVLSATVSFADTETINYTYGTMGRLIKAEYGNGTVVDYVYDNLGNSLHKATTLSGSPVNTPPNAATNPGLSDGSTNVDTRPILTWTGGGDPDTGDQMVYYVYFGTSQDPPLVWSGRQSSYVPGDLRSKTTYYWKVVSRDCHNAETSSPLWSFTTEYKPLTVSFIGVPAYGTAPLEVQFADKSGNADQTIVSWAWDFNSDGTVDSTLRSPFYTFASPGKYSVTLKVTDSYGGSGELKKKDYVRVYESPTDIDGNVTWTRAGSPYYISHTILVVGTLTIEPGVIVKFEQGAYLKVFGILKALGTATDPIYFTDIRDDAAGGDDNGDGTATSPEPGWWGGIRIIGGGKATLDYTVIRYGGSLRDDPNIYVGSSGASSCGSLSLTNSTVSDSVSYGIHIECSSDAQTISGNIIEKNGNSGIYLNGIGNGATISENTIKDNVGHGIYVGVSNDAGGAAAISGNTIKENRGYGIYIDASTDPPVLSSNTIDGNTLGRFVIGGTILRNVTWIKAGGPYVIDKSVWVSSGATLTIEPGVVVKLGKDAHIGVFGGLIAGGTSAERIYFTDLRDDAVGGDTNGDGAATSPAPGGWAGIIIVTGGTANIDHAVVRYGGPRIPDDYNPGYYNLYSNIEKRGPGSVSITNSTISDSAAYGIHIENTSDAQTISGNIMERNGDSGIYLNGSDGGVMLGGNTIRDNGGYGIYVDGETMPILSNNTINGNALGMTVRQGTISKDITWTKAGSPYVVGSIDIDANATLTVEPGVVIKFVKGGGLWVSGGLHAAGTATEPIYFTDLRDDAAGGDTNGDGAATSPAPGWWKAIYIGDGGTATLDHTVVRYGGEFYGANIYNMYNYGVSGSISVTNSIISDSSAHAIYLDRTSDQTISGNIITRNGKSGIYLWNVGSTVLTNNIIAGNTGGGVSYTSNGLSPPGSGSIDIINNTITSNSADNNAGIAFWNFSGPTINFYNNIIWSNTALNGKELYVGSGATVNGYNNDFDPARMIGTFTYSGTNINADPMFVDAANSDYHLSASSPCINSGSNSSPSLPAADFEGDNRIIDSVVDIGADEYTVFPNTSISGMPSNPSKTDSAIFTFVSTKQNSTFECRLDGGAFAACASPANYSALPDGSHTFYVKSTSAGYSEPTPATYTWTIDTTGPNSPVVNGTSPTKNARPAWTWTSGGVGNGRYRYKLDNSDLTTGATETMATGYSPALAMTEGGHTLYVQEWDNAGNWSVSGSKTIVVDVTAPETTITGKPDTPTNLKDASFDFSASEAGSTFQCRLDGGAFAACASPANYSALSDGSHTFSVKATDAVGNTAATPSSYTWTIDTVAPTAPLVGGATPAKNSKPTWTWTSGGGGGNGTYRYKLDDSNLNSGATETTTTSYAPANALPDGSHTLYVQEKDGADNWSASGSFTIIVDTTPVVSGGAYANNSKPTWTWTSGGGGGNGTYRYKLDDSDLNIGATETTATSYTPANGLADGWHTLYIQERDGAGNWSASANFRIIVDTIKPSSSITSPTSGTIIRSATILISGDAADTGTVKWVELSFDGGKTFNTLADGMFVWMYLWEPAEDGTFTIMSRATDMAGNEEIPSGGITITVQRMPGDVDGSGGVSLADAILAMQVLVRIPVGGVHVGVDVNNDGKIGLAEVIYILQKVAEMR